MKLGNVFGKVSENLIQEGTLSQTLNCDVIAGFEAVGQEIRHVLNDKSRAADMSRRRVVFQKTGRFMLKEGRKVHLSGFGRTMAGHAES